MKNCLIFFILFTTSYISAEQVCTGVYTDTTPCYNDQNSCSANNAVLEENEKVCGACPGCHQYIGAAENCSHEQSNCFPGYECVADICKAKAKSCAAELEKPCHNYNAVCLDGDFAPRQCKGQKPTGRCYCSSKSGSRIFGESEWKKADNMTCACSRRVLELQDRGRKDVTLHCSQEGNYEELQCDDGQCWCSEPKTGLPTSRILPESMMTMLYCYNETRLGSQYLRKCESKLVAQGKIAIEAEYHGYINPSFEFLKCDVDGTYAPVQKSGNQLECVWKDNVALGFSSDMSGISEMTCRCARDLKMYSYIHMTCQGNGNYMTKQVSSSGTEYDVDEDGFAAPCGSNTRDITDSLEHDYLKENYTDQY